MPGQFKLTRELAMLAVSSIISALGAVRVRGERTRRFSDSSFLLEPVGKALNRRNRTCSSHRARASAVHRSRRSRVEELASFLGHRLGRLMSTLRVGDGRSQEHAGLMPQ